MLSDRVKRQIDRLLDEAEQAITQGDWATVSDQARSVLRLDPENADAMAYLAAARREPEISGPQPAETNAPTSSSSTAPALATTSAVPASFANGRYQVKRFLGEGGKKKVYLAHDTLLDREVAFALIKTEGLDEAGRSRIQREAQAMGRLGSHQHIVTVFDLGQEQDQPYMVTELMGGGDVEGLIEKASDHRLSIEQAIDIAQETCRGLEFAHGRGIVHRDLKPGNVWLTSDGVAKIGDFGLAVALDRSRLTTEGMMVGTVSYMPPEQAMGGEVTPQSDLYSLGAMLYEMVTGRPPFLGDDSVAIIGQHINTPPVAPIWHNGQCQRSLEALILRLLAKDPSERPESASDVLSALDAIDLSDGPPLERGDGGISDPSSLDSLAGGVFVGRQREMGDLKAALEDALSGRGRLVTLVGEPGIGKTRTAQELATYAGLRGAQVLWGRGYEEQGVPPYWPWVQAIRSYVRDRDPERLRSEMGSVASEIAEIVSEVRERLPDIQPPPALQPEQARFRLFDSITTFMKTVSRTQPLVLMLDDLHWADKPSFLLLEFLARELAGVRLLVVGTYRDVELSRQHPLAETLGELNRSAAGGLQRVLLRGLAPEDIARFIEIAAGITPPQGLVSAVHTQTEGNPLFVTEVVRLLVQDRALTPDPSPSGRGETEGRGEGESWTVRIPEGVTEVIGRRLNRLSQRCNETLTIASVIGREFELRQLAPLIEDVSEDRLLEVLEEALAARVVEELPSAVGRYQFTHALIQETLAEELSTTRRVRLHARIAEALEELYGADAQAHAAELAHHFAEAEGVLGTDKLVRYSLLAGERTMAIYAYEEALAHFQRGLNAKEGRTTGPVHPELVEGSTSSGQGMDAETAALLHGLGRTQLIMLQVDEGWANLTRAFDYYAEVGDIARVVDIADNPVSYTAPGNIAPLLGRALELVPPESYEAGRLLPWHGRLLNALQGDYEGAQQALSRGLAIAKREGDIALQMQALAFTADVEGSNFHWHQASEKALQAIELTRHADNPLAEGFAHIWAGTALASMGHDRERVRHHYAAALTAGERLHDRVWLPTILGVGANIRSSWGDWRVAREFIDRGLALAPSHPTILTSGILLEYQVGDFEQGETLLIKLEDVMHLSAPGPTIPYVVIAMVIPMVARITGVADGFDIAETVAGAVLSSPSATPFITTFARIGLALIAVERADAATAAEQFSALEPRRGTMLTTLALVVSADHLLGLLSATTGNLEQAATHFEDALVFCRKAGYRTELAWTCCDYADMLLERASTSSARKESEEDRRRAITLLDESLAISSELGMRPLMERVLSRREILGA